MRSGDESCVAIGRLCTVNFVKGQYTANRLDTRLRNIEPELLSANSVGAHRCIEQIRHKQCVASVFRLNTPRAFS